jgi:hypothetical protein
MSRAASLLLEAYRRRKERENRLTEVLATVLSGDAAFGRALLRRVAGSEVPDIAKCKTFEVTTQLGVTTGWVDLQLVAVDDGRVPRARVWVESKTGADFQPDQLPRYHRDLMRYPGDEPRWLVTIVEAGAYVDEDERWQRFTWRDVAQWLWETGRSDTGDANWRVAAGNSDAAAHQRIRQELLTYLEEEHDVSVDPLSHDEVFAFSAAADAFEQIGALLEQAAKFSGHWTPVGRQVSWDKTWETAWINFEGTGTWAEREGGWIDLAAASSDEWTEDRLGEPVIGAGFSLPSDRYEGLRSQTSAPWREKLRAQNISFTLDEYVRCFRVVYLAELIAKGPTLDSQAKWLSEWADQSINVIASLDPGPVPVAPGRKRTRANAAADEGSENDD